MSFKRQLLLNSSALVLVMGLAACGGGGDSGSAPGPVGSPAPAPAPPAAPPPTPAPPPPPAGTPTPDPSPGGTVACAPGDAPQVRATAFTLINLTRTTLGLPQLARLPAFDGTAQAHAQYVVANNSPALEETPGLPCFTGVDLAQRLAGAGIVVPDSPGVRARAEIVIGYLTTGSVEPQPWDYVSDALNSLYSRMFLLDARVQHLGLGFSIEPAGQSRAMVLDTALLPGTVVDSSVWTIWPRDGATALPTRMRASNMKPLAADITEGYPISLHAAAAVQVSRFVLSTATDGLPVTTTLVTSANDRNRFLSGSEAALVPHAPLMAGTTYRVEFEGSAGATPLRLVWSFTTAP